MYLLIYIVLLINFFLVKVFLVFISEERLSKFAFSFIFYNLAREILLQIMHRALYNVFSVIRITLPPSGAKALGMFCQCGNWQFVETEIFTRTLLNNTCFKLQNMTVQNVRGQ